MLPIEKLEQLARRYRELDELMCSPDVLGDRNQLAKLNEERSDLEPLDRRVRSLPASSTRSIADDEEALGRSRAPRAGADAELPELEAEREALENADPALALADRSQRQEEHHPRNSQR